MPATHIVPVDTDPRVYIVLKNGVERVVKILQKRPTEVYVHYVDMDKRMDEWVPAEACRVREPPAAPLKRKRGRPPRRDKSPAAAPASVPPQTVPPQPPADHAANGAHAPTEVVMTEEDFDLRHHKQLTAQRNFDMVIFDSWKIRPWYFSPYPLTEAETDEVVDAPAQPAAKIPGVTRATVRSHGRTSDLLAGGLLRPHTGESMLWVCHFCFKYMADGGPWELHKKDCKMKHPPGKKMYQRGAHTIWEVDGAKEKLYCQNLSLFGKLFIDVKTLFFDCDNFLFYILTDAKSSEDHILGFFSKEKLSYDDYNLACIMTLPQYQRKGYGMLLIEFSYELSRRAGKVGTPERPLSDLGLRSYLAYWISTLIRFFRRVLCVLPPDIVSIRTDNNFPNLMDESSDEVSRMPSKKKKKPTKGFDGEVAEANIEQRMGMMPLKAIQEPAFTSRRSLETTPREDGGAETHVELRCTLGEIARATNLRVDDAAFALSECGLLMRRIAKKTSPGAGGEGSSLSPSEADGEQTPARESDTVVITRALVEQIARERRVKIMYLDLSCVIP